MITSEHHIQEVLDAPNHQLSLHAVAKEVCTNSYAPHASNDVQSSCSQDIQCMDSSGKISEAWRGQVLCAHWEACSQRIFRSFYLNWDRTLPRVSNGRFLRASIMKVGYCNEIEDVKVLSCALGASFVRIFPAVKRVITTANCLIFFGPDLCEFATVLLILANSHSPKLWV